MTEPRESAETSPRRRGYCPGVFRPMASGDGLIVRVRTSARALDAARLRALAELAGRHGNGLVELTRRANLQLRGVREATLAPLQRELTALGLADGTAERERALAPLLLSPRLDYATDLRELASQLEHTLLRGPADLPSKFSLLLDDAQRWLADVPADVRLAVRGDGLVDLSVADREHGERWLGALAMQQVVPAVSAILDQLSRAQYAGHVRMRDFIEGGEAALRAALGTLSAVAPQADAPVPSLIGFIAEPPGWFGVSLPFGAGSAVAWLAIAAMAEQYGHGTLRITPQRSVLLAGIQASDVGALRAHAARHGLLVDPADAMVRAIACAGAPACASAYGDTRELAASLVPALAGRTLHVSGCEKSCAHGGRADVTLLRTQHGVQLGFGADVPGTARTPVQSLESARRRLTALGAEVRVRAPMDRHYEYVRDGAEIYRRSFAIIRAEAQLSRFSRSEERIAVRLIHTCGMVDLADDLVFTRGFAEAAEAAIRRGAPILCDANMIVSGVTRARLSAHNDLVCTLDDARVRELAAQQRTTRSAAALSLWGERLEGAVVAIGNAPTALFRLLELLDESALRPAAIIGLPVGFVGAAESKEALLSDGRVPSMIVRGRRGGSAMTVAAINALASDEE